MKETDRKQEKKILDLPFGKATTINSAVSQNGFINSDAFYPDDLPTDLQPDKKNSTFYRMGLNSIISSVFNLYSSLLLTIKWSIRKSKNFETSKEDIKLFDSIVNDMEHSWLEFIENSLSFLQYGWVAFEIVLKKRKDGKIGIRKLQYIPQRTLKNWKVSETGEVLGLIQKGNEFNKFQDVFVPKERMILISNNGANGSPEGKSILTGAYQDWITYEMSEKSIRTTMLRSFVGTPIVRIPEKVIAAANATDADSRFTKEEKEFAKISYNSYKDLLKKMQYTQETGFIIPSDTYKNENGSFSTVERYDISLMSLNGQALVDINSLRTNTEARIARVLLGDFLQMGTSGKTGTYSLGNTRYDMFANAVNVVADKIVTEINETLFPILCLFNNMKLETMPIMHHTKVNEASMKDKIETLAQYMYANGTILPDENIDMAVREALDLPTDIKRPDGWKPEWEQSNETTNNTTSSTTTATPGKTVEDTSKRTRASGKNNINNNKK